MPKRERFRMCEVPEYAHFFHTMVLLMPSHPIRFPQCLMLHDCCAVMATRWELRRSAHRSSISNVSGLGFSFSSNRFCNNMDNLSGYAHRPLSFVLRYLRQHLAAHVVILTAVVAAVACSVGTQYGVKNLVDGLSGGHARAGS